MEIGNYPAQKLLKNEIIYYQFLNYSIKTLLIEAENYALNKVFAIFAINQ